MAEANYDPTGEVAVWEEAARVVLELLRTPAPDDQIDDWNTALHQASRALEKRGRELKQANGMYCRPLTEREVKPIMSPPADA